jgi:hypothetical protein
MMTNSDFRRSLHNYIVTILHDPELNLLRTEIGFKQIELYSDTCEFMNRTRFQIGNNGRIELTVEWNSRKKKCDVMVHFKEIVLDSIDELTAYQYMVTYVINLVDRISKLSYADLLLYS